MNENINWNNILINSSEKGDLEGVKKAIEQGADVHSHYDYSLRRASFEGHLPVVKYLVEQGADVHAENDESLICASEQGHLPVVKYLVSVYEERRKFRELLNVYDELPKKTQEYIDEKYPWLQSAADQNLI